MMRVRWLAILVLFAVVLAGTLITRPRSAAQVPGQMITPQIPSTAERITRLWVTMPSNGLVTLSWTAASGTTTTLQFPDAQAERAFFLVRQHAERKNVLVDRNVLPPVFYVDFR
ncbi:MAG: hypothetical protein HY660_15795 [Armatimonadetes bacterium]|nr:hypothetical protein [Armatimonadota bacterium]